VSGLRLDAAHAAWAQLAADLVNTAPRATNPGEKLAGAADVERLLAGAPERAPAATAADVGELRALRAQLARAFEASTLEQFADAVNPLLAGAVWQVGRRSDGAWGLEPARSGRASGWFAARAARGLAELVTAYGLERLHVCRADDCLRAVVDVSRNGTRRYCSRTCANRTNVRRHRATQR
jgi:predicted RNA-binding Zn ribbon-like protein